MLLLVAMESDKNREVTDFQQIEMMEVQINLEEDGTSRENIYRTNGFNLATGYVWVLKKEGCGRKIALLNCQCLRNTIVISAHDNNKTYVVCILGTWENIILSWIGCGDSILLPSLFS